MFTQKVKQAMTLIEIIIVIAIMGVFVGVLFGTYKRMSDISLKVERDQILNTQYLGINQILQNMTEEYAIDYDRYGGSLADTQGWTNVLHLTGSDGGVTLQLTGDCGHDLLTGVDMLPSYVMEHTCWLQMDYGDIIIDLVDPQQIYVHRWLFKVMPWDALATIYSVDSGLEVEDLRRAGFWLQLDMTLRLYSPFYWVTDTRLETQQFFTLRQR